MALIEAVRAADPRRAGRRRLRPTEESFATGLLEYPQYTRPQSFEGRAIPEVLTGGNHAEIAKWRQGQAESLTKARRPDLWTLYEKPKR